ncbi:MAG: hypothetical protein AB7G37_14550, partial [Solirubrobacteraceae bacterium]
HGDGTVDVAGARLTSTATTFAPTDVGQAITVGGVTTTIVSVENDHEVTLAAVLPDATGVAIEYRPSILDGVVATITTLTTNQRTFGPSDVGRAITVGGVATTIAAIVSERTVKLAATIAPVGPVAFTYDDIAYGDGVVAAATVLRSASTGFVREDAGGEIRIGGTTTTILARTAADEVVLADDLAPGTGIAFRYDPAFSYRLSEEEERFLAAGVKVWTPEQLQNLLGAGLLKPVTSTLALMGDTVISARNVTLIAEGLNGSVGRSAGEELIVLDGAPFSPEENVILGSAERADLQYVGGFGTSGQVDIDAGAGTIRRSNGASWQGIAAGDVIRVMGVTAGAPSGAATYTVAAVVGDTITLTGAPQLVTQLGVEVSVTALVDPTITLTASFRAADGTTGAMIVDESGTGWGALAVGDTIAVLGNTPNATGSAGSSGVSYYTIAQIVGNAIVLADGDDLTTTGPTTGIRIRPIVVDPTFVAVDDETAIVGATFVNRGVGPAGRLGDRIVSADFDFGAAGFVAGDLIRISGTGLNDTAAFTPYTIVAVDGRTLTLAQNAILIDQMYAGELRITRGRAPVLTHIAVAKVKPMFIEALGTLDAKAGGNVLIASPLDLNVGTVDAPGRVHLKTKGSIYNASAGSTPPVGCGAAGVRVNACTGDLVLEAGSGRIGSVVAPFYTDFVDGAVDGTLTARAQDDVHIHNRRTDGLAGDLRIESVYSERGTIHLEADGSILDALGTAFTKLYAPVIELHADGTIGASGNALEILTTGGGTVDARAAGSIWITATNLAGNAAPLDLRRVMSSTGDVTLQAASIRHVGADDTVFATAPPVPVALHDVAVIGNSITLIATLGAIGEPGNELQIQTRYSTPGAGTLTSASTLDNTYVVQPFGDLYLAKVSTTGTTSIAFISALDGAILNGLPTGSLDANVTSGKAKLFAKGDIGRAFRPLTTGSGLGNAIPGTLQGTSTTGGVWIVNVGPVDINCVALGACTDVDGISAAGAVDIQTLNGLGATNSLITLLRNVLAGGPVSIGSGIEAGNDNDVHITAGRSVRSLNGAVTIEAGGNVVLGAGAFVLGQGGTDGPGDVTIIAGLDGQGGSIRSTSANVTAATGAILARADGGHAVLEAGSSWTARTDVSVTAGLSVHAVDGTALTALDGDLTLIAQNGDLVVGDTVVLRAGRDLTGTATGLVDLRSHVDAAAVRDITITAGGDLVAVENVGLVGGRDITITVGGDATLLQFVTFDAGRDLRLDVGGDLTAGLRTTLTAGQDLGLHADGDVVLLEWVTATAGRDLEITGGGRVEIGKDADVSAARHLAIGAGTDILLSRATTITATLGDVSLTATSGSIVAIDRVTVSAGRVLTASAGQTIQLRDDATIAAQRDLTLRTVDGDVLIGVGSTPATVRAFSGRILIQSGRHVHTWPTALLIAAEQVSIYGDALDQTTTGAIITLEGSIAAPLILVFGNSHDDVFLLDHVALGGRTRLYGSSTPTPESSTDPQASDADRNRFAPEGDGDDVFIVNRLPTMQGVASGNTVTIDGQSGSNTVTIQTSGSQSQIDADYVINVLGTGAPDTGVQTLNIYGVDNHQSGTNPLTGLPYPVNDIFLLRSATTIPFESHARPDIYRGTGDDTGDAVSADPYSAGPAFVALLHASIEEVAPDPTLGVVTATAVAVERINYDSSTSRLNVYAPGGNAYFAVDDNSAITTLDGGTGDTTFQIGQIYGLKRNGEPGQGNVAPADVFDFATVATTRGWLSRGNSRPLVAQGGRNNTYTVYSNHAELSLQGGLGDNLFVIQGFALAEVDADGDLVLPEGCSAIQPPGCLPTPRLTSGFSTAADTKVRTGGGSNQVVYNMTAPVAVEGGAGFNKLAIRGTEYADHIVVTDRGVFGVGTGVSYRNIQLIEVNGLEGDDTIDVLSTAPGVVVRLIGGLGSDQFNVGGDVNGAVYAQDTRGSSAAINHRIISSDRDYTAVPTHGINLNVAQAAVGAVVIEEGPFGTTVAETTDGAPIGTTASYTVRLAQAPRPGEKVYVTVSAQGTTLVEQAGLDGGGIGDSILVARGIAPARGTTTTDSDFYDHVHVNGSPADVKRRSLVLVFDETNWAVGQAVTVGAVNDERANPDRRYVIGASVLSGDPFFDNATVSNVTVLKRDVEQVAIVTTQLAGDGATPDDRTTVLAGPAPHGITDRYALSLGRVPTAPVTVAITLSAATASLASTDPRFQVIQAPTGTTPGRYAVTFTPSDATTPVLVDVRGVGLGVVLDTHEVAIQHAIAPSSASEYLPTTTTAGAPQVTVYATVVGDKAPGLLLEKPDRMVVTRCGMNGNQTDCSVPGPGASYTARLTTAPEAGHPVKVILDGDGQTDIDVAASGGRIALEAIGTAGAGLWTGSVVYDAAAGTLRRADGSSWLDDGFLEGQLLQLNGTGPLLKIQQLLGSDPTRVDVLRVTTAGVLPWTGSGTTSASVVRWAATVTFTAADWWIPVVVPVVADPYYDVPVGTLSTVTFAKRPHLLNGIRGPVEIVGGPQVGDRTFAPAVMLPTEQNGPLFGIREQPTEADQVDVLNIYDDGAQGDQGGTMYATGLSGFGMGGDLRFTRTAFGEPTTFAGGISWGRYAVDADGNPLRNAGLTTVDVVNLMLGQGNDRLVVAGTPTPGPDVELDGTTGVPSAHGGLTVIHGGGAAKLESVCTTSCGFATTANTITRRDGLSWASLQFSVGHELLVNGVPHGRITAIDGTRLTFTGKPLAVNPDFRGTVAVYGPKVASRAAYAFLSLWLVGNVVNRADLKAWTALGYRVGQQITVDGVVLGTIASLVGSTMTYHGAAQPLGTRTVNIAVYDPADAVAVGGNVITVLGGGG